MKLNAIIIDDEHKSGETLHSLINEYCKNVSVERLADSLESGVAAIRNLQPQLVFLDIELQNATGFDLLEQVRDQQFEVIFTTAFEQYALRAFQFCAVDYILKPVDSQALIEAVKKVEDKVTQQQAYRNIEVLLQNFKTPQPNHKIALPTSDGLVFLMVKDIMRLEADGSYTHFFFRNGKKLLVSKKIKEYEELLAPYRFYRVHHSHMVNLEEIEKYVRGEGGYVVLTDGSVVYVSKRKKEDFMAILDKA